MYAAVALNATWSYKAIRGVYKALKTQLAEVLVELKRIAHTGEISPELRETLDLIAVTLDGMKGEAI